MKRCRRCGIDFNAVGVECRDCVDVQIDLGDLDPITARREAYDAEIRHLHSLNFTDRQIGARVGRSDQTIYRYRRDHHMPPSTAIPRDSHQTNYRNAAN